MLRGLGGRAHRRQIDQHSRATAAGHRLGPRGCPRHWLCIAGGALDAGVVALGSTRLHVASLNVRYTVMLERVVGRLAFLE